MITGIYRCHLVKSVYSVVMGAAMTKNLRTNRIFPLALAGILFLAAGCSRTATPVVPQPTPTATAGNLPAVLSVGLDQTSVPRYESVEMTVAIDASYTNPFDARQVSLDGVFSGPGGVEMKVPGFWDGVSAWKVRFTPSREGEWKYQLTVKDSRGPSAPWTGSLTATASNLHGWLQPGNSVNPDYSGHYLVYQDGTPFYGIGHCDALNLFVGGFSADTGLAQFDQMKAAKENFVVWWPFYSNSLIGTSYDNYSSASASLMDLVVKDAQKKGVFLVFTIWDHPELRGPGHPWGDGNWAGNGFSKLGDINSFFTSDEMWAWQENLYRYLIARWGYSPAIGLWQTVSEINGTNAYDQTNPWHEKVNAYFAANDPYRHPTTASMSGDVDWPEGHQVMDAPQVHVYNFANGSLTVDAVKTAQIIAGWTQLMWNQAAKPNWIGEFGVAGNEYYPELFHNALWAALGAGSAMTPAEWNGGAWGEMTPEMQADTAHLAQFVSDIPLAEWNPAPLQFASGDPQVRGWGVAGSKGGLFWVQDFSLEGKSIDEVRKGQAVRKGAVVEISGLAGGTYTVHPYDTWKGQYLTAINVTCSAGSPCTIALPDFTADMAFRIERK
jgi:hypothetical protein